MCRSSGGENGGGLGWLVGLLELAKPGFEFTFYAKVAIEIFHIASWEEGLLLAIMILK